MLAPMIQLSLALEVSLMHLYSEITKINLIVYQIRHQKVFHSYTFAITSVINDIIGLATFGSELAAFAIIAINGGIAARVGPRKAKFSKATTSGSLPGYKAI